MRLPKARSLQRLGASVVAAAALAACGGGEEKIELEFLGRYSTGQFGVSAAEIPAYDAGTRRLFVVNALSGHLDVLDMSSPAQPVKVGEIAAEDVLAGAVVNSVAVHKGIVALAIEAPVKTDPGRVALYRASDLTLLGSATVGALPDMLVFTPNGKHLLVANEGEPSDDYQIDPEGSISVVDVFNPNAPTVQTADFSAFSNPARS